MQPAFEHDRLDIRQACPRCYETLEVADSTEERAHPLLLACPEVYCDYVLVVTQRESFTGRKWSWPELFARSGEAGHRARAAG